MFQITDEQQKRIITCCTKLGIPHSPKDWSQEHASVILEKEARQKNLGTRSPYRAMAKELGLSRRYGGIIHFLTQAATKRRMELIAEGVQPVIIQSEKETDTRYFSSRRKFHRERG